MSFSGVVWGRKSKKILSFFKSLNVSKVFNISQETLNTRVARQMWHFRMFLVEVGTLWESNLATGKKRKKEKKKQPLCSNSVTMVENDAHLFNTTLNSFNINNIGNAQEIYNTVLLIMIDFLLVFFISVHFLPF